MALIQVNFISECLKRTVTLNAVVPFDKLQRPGMEIAEPKEFKTLYLLHGLLGNYTDWISGTRVQRWAEEKNLAVIMPSGENHFYVDCEANGERFSEFIGRELPEKMCKLFPLSTKREDTFIGGLSMGGYGAITNGLKYGKTFSHVAGLSSALIIEGMGKGPELSEMMFGKQFSTTVFGDLAKLSGSDKDYYALAEKYSKDAANAPKMYICCGTEDGLLEANRKYADFVQKQGIDCTYEEGPGNHDWDFWDSYIKKVIDWLPLDDKEQGVHSGNVEAMD